MPLHLIIKSSVLTTYSNTMLKLTPKKSLKTVDNPSWRRDCG